MSKLAVGIMSGTSGDGVSLALCSFQNSNFKVLRYRTYPYASPLRRSILNARFAAAGELSKLNMALGIRFAKVLKTFLRESRVSASRVRVVGSHGQTVFHGPNDSPRNTLQLGEPSLMAQQTGIPVVADFRPSDIAAGGQGAPLIPFFDDYFFGDSRSRAMQNIGGIANVTVVGKNKKPYAFDTGPGNCLIDWAVSRMTKGRLDYDAEGKIASRGLIDFKAVDQMAAHPYFSKRPPKSTGRELFSEDFIPKKLLRGDSAKLVATLTYFSAYSIWLSYKRWLPGKINEIVVSGGGALNKTLMSHLSNLFAPVPVRSIEEWGLPAQAKEPAAFAFFALRAIQGKVNSLPAVTGAKRATILGKIIPGKTPYAFA